MTLNATAFMQASLSHRQSTVAVGALSTWFDGKAEWVVRGLSATELLAANAASEKQKNLAAAVEAIAGSVGKDKIPATQKLLGIVGQTDAEMAKRLELLVSGSVSPEITLDIAVKLADNFPVEFMQLTNEILKLTSEGADVLKPKPSGKTQK